MAGISPKQFATARSTFLRTLTGETLEIGAGNGANFHDLSPDVTWHGLEPHRRAYEQLAAHAARHGHTNKPIAGGAENLPLPDESFDTVFGTLALCSVTDVRATLNETFRVLRPGGTLAVIEHISSDAPRMHAFQAAISPLSARLVRGCRWDRNPLEQIARSGFVTQFLEKEFVKVGFGIRVPFILYRGTKPLSA